jgi:cardiolipin synthase
MKANTIEENRGKLFPSLSRTGEARIKYLPHKPYDEQRLRLIEAHLMLLRNARQHIYWGCHGTRPPRVMAETLIGAVNRSVDVRLITNSKLSSKSLMLRGLLGWMYSESSRHFRYLVENGVRIYEWQKPGAFHSKNLVVDDVVASIGSFNIARGSTFHHTESNVIVFGGDFPSQVREQFEVDFRDCNELAVTQSPMPKPENDPYARLLHPRNRLIASSLLPETVKRDLDQGHIKDVYFEEEALCQPIDPSEIVY